MRTLFFIVFCGFVSNLMSQVVGLVQDELGQPLPLVSIYINGTSIGTTTNGEGIYHFKVPQGKHELVFQFVGYTSVYKVVDYKGSEVIVDVKMEPESLLLDEIFIAADAEDPAYRIIRKAIEKREYYKNQIKAYSCDVYVKGYNKILDAPEKIMGIEVGDMDGTLDTNRQGIVYLSESVSNLYYQSPDQYKEVITSSKISGDDQGYSFNSAKEMQFSIYEPTMDLNRAIISPIADNALSYYRYRLEGAFYDEENRLINKIKVLPKREADPVFYGDIYIIEDLWNIHSFTLGLTAQSSQLYVLDSLTFEQVFIPLEEPDVWGLFSNVITFEVNIFGFVFTGEFTGIHSNYNLQPNFDKGFFNSVTHIVEAQSNERDSTYWAEIRPVPLSIEESTDYIEKDSIFKMRNSPVYKDSVDREHNQFGIGDVLSGYSYQNSNQNLYWNISSPISSLSYNTVQGLHGAVDVNFRKYFDEKETNRILFYSTINYSGAEKIWRPKANMVYRPNRTSSTQYNLFAGREVFQFNGSDPISDNFNMLYTIFAERNYAKYYDKKYYGFSWRTDIAPPVVLTSSLRYEQRAPLVNNVVNPILDRDNRAYTSNDPTGGAIPFNQHNALILDLIARIRFGQKYVMFPDRRFSDGYKGPEMTISWRSAMSFFNGDVTYQKLAFSISDSKTLGLFGDLNFYANGGLYFNAEEIPFVDYRHFMGNRLTILESNNYHKRFLAMDYYSRSAADKYFQAHIHHDFNGWILDKIPGINQLGFSLVAGAKYLHSDNFPDYVELHLGLNNLGWNFFRLLRLDGVWSYSDGRGQWHARIGIGFDN